MYDPNVNDVWLTIWGGEYTSGKYYKYIYDVVQAHPVF